MYFKVIDYKDFVTEPIIIHNKNNRRNKIKLSKNEYEETILKWRLSEFVKKKEYDPDECSFTPISSSDFLSNGLSCDKIIGFINTDLIFENYLPQENDFLKIWLEYKHPEIHRKGRPIIDRAYLSFIFSEKWIKNEGFDHIDNIYEEIFGGEILLE